MLANDLNEVCNISLTTHSQLWTQLSRFVIINVGDYFYYMEEHTIKMAGLGGKNS